MDTNTVTFYYPHTDAVPHTDAYPYIYPDTLADIDAYAKRHGYTFTFSNTAE